MADGTVTNWLAISAYGGAIAYVMIIRPVRKKWARKPEYKIKNGKIYRS